MKVVVERMSSGIERFRLRSSDKLEEIVAPRLDTAVQLITFELEYFERRANDRIDPVATRSRESIEDVSDRLQARIAEHDESVGVIVVANNKLARSIDIHIEEFRNELYHSLERTKSSEEMQDAELRDLMNRFAVDSVALRREIEARVSTSRPAEPTKTPQIFDMSRGDGMFSRMHPVSLREHVPDVADLRGVASDQGRPLFPQGVVEHALPGSLLNPTQRRREHGGCVAAAAPVASVFCGSTDVNSIFAGGASARSRNELDVQFMSSLPQKSSL